MKVDPITKPLTGHEAASALSTMLGKRPTPQSLDHARRLLTKHVRPRPQKGTRR